ncbi:MAG TPA: ribonuclease HII [Spirochaetia bacterium]|nr:ribonuclease HII [Spirochaetia bacterium]
MEIVTCGVDEAGRGSLAGPVTAAAVVLPQGFPVEKLADSKVLSPQERDEAAVFIKEYACEWSLGWAWPEEIDRYNIHVATLLAMRRALHRLNVQPERVDVDGRFVPRCRFSCRAEIKGDTRIPAVMAASIIAKTARDRWMIRYARIEPVYRFDVHKGYPTPEHRALIKRWGVSAIHRHSFRVTLS